MSEARELRRSQLGVIVRSSPWQTVVDDIRKEYIRRMCAVDSDEAVLAAARQLIAFEDMRERLESQAYDPNNRQDLEVV